MRVRILDYAEFISLKTKSAMNKTMLRFLLLAITAVTLIDGPLRSALKSAEQFRDPLSGKSLATKRSGALAQPTLLNVTLNPIKEGTTPQAGEVVVLSIGLKLPDDGYTYSTNPDFPGPTRIILDKSLIGVEPADEAFAADHPPQVEFSTEFNQNIEKFKSNVVWSRRFRLLPGAKPEEIRIAGRVKYQICDARHCTPHDESFAATWNAPSKVVLTANAHELTAKVPSSSSSSTQLDATKPGTSGATKASGPKPFEIEVIPAGGKGITPVKAKFRLAPDKAKLGEAVTLTITMQLEPGWHTFALDQDSKSVGKPTVIELLATDGLKVADDAFSPTLPPEIEAIDGGLQQRIHHKEISWSRQYTVENPEYGVRGELRYQICREGQCHPLKKVPFELGAVKPEPTVGPEEAPSVVAQPPGEGVGFEGILPAFKGKQFQPIEIQHGPEEANAKKQDDGLALYLLYAFLGGLILNVMPCVLPVIAIKVLSFVQQAGESRSRILMLNLMYSAGVVVVFLLLASLAVFAKFGWGGLFQRPEFQLVMSLMVFAMGLSLLGVFEIPVPGMIGSAASQQHQEGLTGAFLTGMFATLMATPCSGPFLGVTLGWSVKQPAHITYLVWTIMGIGMSFPYLLLGLFPGWVKFIPRPGNWMVTFKQVCGFLLLGTVLFLMSTMKAETILPLLILLLVCGFSLWMIGNLYNINSPSSRKWTTRFFATLFPAITCWWMITPTLQLPWKPFAGPTVQQELLNGRTVLIDFTAEWCLACKVNEKLALNTSDTLALVKEHGVVTLKADWTDESPEIKRWLDTFDSISVPLTVIFPGNDPTKPIIIRDSYTKKTLLQQLGQAVEVKAANQPALTQR